MPLKLTFSGLVGNLFRFPDGSFGSVNLFTAGHQSVVVDLPLRLWYRVFRFPLF